MNTAPKCPDCFNLLLLGDVQGYGMAYACRCGYVAKPKARLDAKTATEDAPGSESVSDSIQAEERVQRAIIDGLTALGFTVLQTTVRYRPCWNCGKRQKRGTGMTPGVPDLLVTRDDWPVGMWMGLECKSAKGRLSEAQKSLQARGRIYVVRSLSDAIRAVKGEE